MTYYSRTISRTLSVVMFCSFSLLASSELRAQMFAGPAPMKAGLSPGPFTIVDVDGDGFLDAVVLNISSSTPSVGVMHGTGGGALGSPVPSLLPTGTEPSALAVADVDGDSKLDAIVASKYANIVSMMLGNGTGLFGVPTNLFVGTNPVSVIAVDLNADGKTDVACANFNGVSIVFSQGGGAFAPAVLVPTGADPLKVDSGDFNSDGVIDLITTDHLGGTVSLLFGLGGGLFSAPSPASAGVLPSTLAVGDVNIDGALDVIVTNSTKILSLGGDGAGSLNFIDARPVGGSVHTLDLGDANSDGSLDALIASISYSSATVLLGAGGGVFGSPQHFGPSIYAADAQFTDLDGDSNLDVTITSPETGGMLIFRGDGSGSYSGAEGYAGGSLPIGLALGDLNSDGHVDAVTAGDTSVWAMLANGSGGFAPVVQYWLTFDDYPGACALGDMNGDSHLDAVTTLPLYGTVRVLPGSGAGTFTLGGMAGGYVAARGRVALGDLNADSNLDLIAVLDSGFARCLGSSTGAVSVSGTTSLPGTIDLALADLNGDGMLDAAATRPFFNSVAILLGTVGGFSSPSTIAVGAPVGKIILSDINVDGQYDLTTANGVGNSVSMYIGDGLGGFSFHSSASSLNNPMAVATCDFHAQGAVSFAVAELGLSTVSILSTIGSSGAMIEGKVAVGREPEAIAAGDIDSDGMMDVATADYQYGSMSILKNLLPLPAATSAYGTGTSGCSGTLSMSANTIPKINTPNFGLVCTNTPLRGFGLGLVTDSQDLAGFDVFGVGILIHVDFFSATEVLGLDFYTLAGGSGWMPAPIPNNPLLVDKDFFAQAVWVEDKPNGQACTTSPLHLVSSRGLSITIQP